MKAEVVKAELGDREILNAICLESKKYWGYPPEWIEHWRPQLTLKAEDFDNSHIYKIILENVIIGFCAILEHPHEYEITHLWLRPSFIGNGYGKMLLHKTMEAVVQKQKDIIVEADPNAEPFYRGQGFTTYIQVESYPEGRYLPVMKKPRLH